MSLDNAFKFFDKYSPEVLTFDFVIRGNQDQLHALKELIMDDGDLGNPILLRERMNKIPGMITFYGTLKDRAEQELSDLKEQWDHWYSEVAYLANNLIIEETQAKQVSAGLKKAPTVAQIEGRVRADNMEEWKNKKDLLSACQALSRVGG